MCLFVPDGDYNLQWVGVVYLSVFVSPLFLKFQDEISPKCFELSSSNLVWWFVMMICCYTLCFAVLARVSPFKLAFCHLSLHFAVLARVLPF